MDEPSRAVRQSQTDNYRWHLSQPRTDAYREKRSTGCNMEKFCLSHPFLDWGPIEGGCLISNPQQNITELQIETLSNSPTGQSFYSSSFLSPYRCPFDLALVASQSQAGTYWQWNLVSKCCYASFTTAIISIIIIIPVSPFRPPTCLVFRLRCLYYDDNKRNRATSSSPMTLLTRFVYYVVQTARVTKFHKIHSYIDTELVVHEGPPAFPTSFCCSFPTHP